MQCCDLFLLFGFNGVIDLRDVWISSHRTVIEQALIIKPEALSRCLHTLVRRGALHSHRPIAAIARIVPAIPAAIATATIWTCTLRVASRMGAC